MADDTDQKLGAALEGPAIVPEFEQALNELVSIARQGQNQKSSFYNPSEEWIARQMNILQDLPQEQRDKFTLEANEINEDAKVAGAEGKAARRAGPGVVVKLDNGGLAFYSQLGVARRPDLTQYYIDGFQPNRDALAFSEQNQRVFTKVLQYVNTYMQERFATGEAIVQTDRQIGDVPGRSFHARQLMFGAKYMQIPYMWRQLTFDLPKERWLEFPDILEVSVPNWMDDLGMEEELKAQVRELGITQLVFKAPTKGLSLHLGFDYVGEHKMGPLSIAMFLVKQAQGVAVQAALSMARVKTISGKLRNNALVTIGPSLHGKSTLTIMIEITNSELSKALGIEHDPEEGVYPMNDDIVLLQRLDEPTESNRDGQTFRISYGIDGTENNFYAVPFGLNSQDDPITYDVVRGSKGTPNSQETLENVPVDMASGAPNYLENPVRNMRMVLSRPRLLTRKGSDHIIETISGGRLTESVHVPMEDTDKVLWQAVMRQNTVVPPLRRLNLEQYIRVLMYGEAVQMGAATGAIGRPYVEYFSDPFIIGLEDDNANLLYRILQEMAEGGPPQEYYAFNTGGLGADTNEEAAGNLYRKVPREITLKLQEALLREAVKFEYDDLLRSDVAVAIVNGQGEEIEDLRQGWLPRNIYGEEEYKRRIVELSRRRYYGQNAEDKAGILRYTKVDQAIYSMKDIPPPLNEREMAWLLSFYWKVDRAYGSVSELVLHLAEGKRPSETALEGLRQAYQAGINQGLTLSPESENILASTGIA